ncbi:hypothetical protein [Micromonospora sp. 4G55]|uniref:hypothetical protein n=1 Tax=Micromonospora sp. 4G55 TaxID=2806102 RepID=UPI001EE46A63|nr:hypothetical protein [Micromonospora sp. 4G55]
MQRPDLSALARQMTSAMTAAVEFAEGAAHRRHVVSSPDGESPWRCPGRGSCWTSASTPGPGVPSTT